ncbi:NAD-dependent epimerase/dehydratase family protein [Actinomyces culturomici]|uniref:NAD-dependent epimerase/dehydratase family protein n=1 Tax=Actinomyces culturomici TaxID=1926276 RepID=UPI000E206F08|nr:NAD-dependent epimerase/dehydratase family protein [Actinomyces culturomici]
MCTPRTLIIGGGGMLGRAVATRARLLGRDVHVPQNVPWSDPLLAVEALDEAVSEMISGDATDWSIFWCAGAGTTATSETAFENEIRTFRSFIDRLTTKYSPCATNLTFFYASSAGGLYAGSSNPPFTEATPPSPISPYGHSKLTCERILPSLSDAGATVSIGRISNLYGPGQDVRKPQGLISHICLAYHSGAISTLYTSLDTLRDYIFIDDAAQLIIAFADECTTNATNQVTVKNIINGSSLSIAEIIGTANAILKRPAPFLQVISHLTSLQARDLRLRSNVMPELDAFSKHSFPSGLMATNIDIGHRFRAGETNSRSTTQ